MYDHTFYKQVQISRSDIRPYIKWAVCLVILHMVTSIFLRGLCEYIWVNIFTLSPQRDTILKLLCKHVWLILGDNNCTYNVINYVLSINIVCHPELVTLHQPNIQRNWDCFSVIFCLLLDKKITIHQVTTMLAATENVLFPSHNHMLTTGTDTDLILWLLPKRQRGWQSIGLSVPVVSRWL